MQWLMLAFVALLFVALTPGVLLRLPPGGSKLVVALTHGVVFAVVLYLTKGFVAGVLYGGREGLMTKEIKDKMKPKKEDSE